MPLLSQRFISGTDLNLLQSVKPEKVFFVIYIMIVREFLKTILAIVLEY